ncbi:hypothetical protein [Paraburkholderia unamae]|uniref:Uncharacterized protein n=1 Tax=Paraburkholderia unamae TaxID=219649 RepID=A0ACC6RWF3_9BURK
MSEDLDAVQALCFAGLVLAIAMRPPLHAYSRQRWIAALVLGSAMAGMMLCYFEAVQRVPLGLGVAISFIGPLFVAMAGIRKFRMLVWCGPWWRWSASS